MATTAVFATTGRRFDWIFVSVKMLYDGTAILAEGEAYSPYELLHDCVTCLVCSQAISMSTAGLLFVKGQWFHSSLCRPQIILFGAFFSSSA